MAAQLASPSAPHASTLGLGPVSLAQLISENETRTAYEDARTLLKRVRDSGEGRDDFNAYRMSLMKQAVERINAGTLAASDMVTE
ncbi:hypothetical protein, partial [Streptomyces scabiei]|uniref:hypothetical protein n=1 Tax=Streptomyces scabiei TaxID=1930 RepID=UPI0038F5E980